MDRKGFVNVLCLGLGTVAVAWIGITGLTLLISGTMPGPRLVAVTVMLGFLFASIGIGLIAQAQKQKQKRGHLPS